MFKVGQKVELKLAQQSTFGTYEHKRGASGVVVSAAKMFSRVEMGDQEIIVVLNCDLEVER